MILIQVGDRFVRTRELRRNWVRPVKEDEEDANIRIESHKHKVDEHYKKKGIAV